MNVDHPAEKAAAVSGAKGNAVASARHDLMQLTKARLSVLVAVTTIFGYLAAGRMLGSFNWNVLWDTLIGTLLAAFASAVFNQIMEVDADARMERTASRPLPAQRMPTALAFVLGWLMGAFGIIHLGIRVNMAAGLLAGLTLFIYLFVYTPMKRRSSWNTVVGAVAGALPPLIGWYAGGAGYDLGAVFLFALLFLWQMPHFLAINWMYRDEYRRAGFVMWSNEDETGNKTTGLALFYSVLLALLPVLPVVSGHVAVWFLLPGLALGGVLVWLAWKFRRDRTRDQARRLFFSTLLYLPVVLAAALLAWRVNGGGAE